MAKTKSIRDALKSTFYPHAIKLGFAIDKRWQPQFVVFRRLSVDKVDIFDIQWDKYHRPKFVINFSEAPLSGVQFGGKCIDTKDLMVAHCGTFHRLVRDQNRAFYRWFQLRRPLLEQALKLKRNYEPDEIATQVIDRFSEVEEWWEKKTIGKHVQVF